LDSGRPEAHEPPMTPEELALEWEREEIEQARAMSIEERLAIGPLLFREAMAFTEAALRMQFPHDDDDAIDARIVERLHVTFHDDDGD